MRRNCEDQAQEPKSWRGLQQEERKRINLTVRECLELEEEETTLTLIAAVQRISFFQGAAKATTGPIEIEKTHDLVQRYP